MSVSSLSNNHMLSDKFLHCRLQFTADVRCYVLKKEVNNASNR